MAAIATSARTAAPADYYTKAPPLGGRTAVRQYYDICMDIVQTRYIKLMYLSEPEAGMRGDSPITAPSDSLSEGHPKGTPGATNGFENHVYVPDLNAA